MISCREVARLALSDEIRDLSWSRRVEVRLHLWMCRHCRTLMRQIQAIRQQAAAWWSRLQQDSLPGESPNLEAAILARIQERWDD